MQQGSRICAVFLLGVFSVFAQQSGTITGVVADVTGKGIPNAVVTVRNEAGGAPKMAATDSEGKYSIKDLTEGSYQVEAAAPSFALSRRNGVKITAAGAANAEA